MIKDETISVGSRAGGGRIRNKILNLLDLAPEGIVVIDFRDVGVISSSFADEALAKIVVELGQSAFAKRVAFRNVDHTVRMLIDKAIAQRVAVQALQQEAR
jgi:hypothetical protein